MSSKTLKLVYIVLGVILLLAGLVGLLFPVIPGILFIALALYLLGKVSRRVRDFADGNVHLRRVRERMDAMEDVGVVDRVRLAGWMCLDAFVSALAAFESGVRSVSARVTGR